MYRSKFLWAMVAIGLALRVLYGLAQDPLAPYGTTGGDDPWYLANALALVTDAPPGTVIHGMPTDVANLNQPPVFFLVAGIPQALLSPGPAVQVIRLLQAVLSSALIVFGYGLAVRLAGGIPGWGPTRARRAGQIAAAILALSPALILESAHVKTETLFLFFVTGGVWAFVEAVVRTRAVVLQSNLTPRPPLQPDLTPRPPLQSGEGEQSTTAAVGAQRAAPDGEPHPPTPSPLRSEGEETAPEASDAELSPANAGSSYALPLQTTGHAVRLEPVDEDDSGRAVARPYTPLPAARRHSGSGEGQGVRAGSEPGVMADAGTPLTRGKGEGFAWFALAGVLLGLATLTRAVFLLFPLALVVFAPIALGWRPGWKRGLLLLVVYSGVVLTWTAYNLARYDRFVLAGDGFASFLFIGAVGWNGPQQSDQTMDQILGPNDDGSRDQAEFLDAAESSIGANLPGYLARRIRELGGAILQPHNVEVYAGDSLRSELAVWWADDRSPAGLLAITQGNSFWPKLLLYVVHYGGLVLGAAGALLTWRNWRVGLPLLGYVAYVLLVHLFLFALPRYLFPILPFLWVFAGVAMARVLSKE